MIKVLILAHDFPPYISVGALRPYSWYKYLTEFDIFPIVVTRHWTHHHSDPLAYIKSSDSLTTIEERTKNGVIIKTPYQSNLRDKIMLKFGKDKFAALRKMLTGYYETAQFLATIGPKSSIYYAARDFIAKNKIDLIIATGEPFVLFKYAKKLCTRYNIPWIADYRDPWSHDNDRKGKRLSKALDIYLEKRYCSTATAITTVNPFFKHKIESLIQNVNVHIIENGYDPEAVNSVRGIEQDHERFRIAFVGTIYKWHPLESFLSVCLEFISKKKNPKFVIEFLGCEKDIIDSLIQTKFPQLASFIEITPKQQNEITLRKSAKANVLLLFNYYSYTGTKIYDYLALKRKIILCYSNDKEANELKKKYYNMDEVESTHFRPQEELITKTNAGMIIKDSDHLFNVLNELYDEFTSAHSVKCSSQDIEQFSRKEQTRRLSILINEVLKKE